MIGRVLRFLSGVVRDNETRAFLVGLVAPLVLVFVGLKAWRVYLREEVSQWYLVPDLLRSEVMVVVAFVSLGLVGLRCAGRPGIRRAVVAGMQIVGGGLVAIEIFSHFFFVETGSVLDLNLMLFSLTDPELTGFIVTTLTPREYWIFFAIVMAVLAGFPWFVLSQSEIEEVGGEAAVAPLLVVAVVACGLALPATPGEYYSAFSRASVINVGLALVSSPDDVEWSHRAEERPELEGLGVQAVEDGRQGPRNVVIVILESVRAASTTIHNPELATTPFLAELAERSLVAQRGYAVVPHTSKALVAILCGVEPRLHMPITEATEEGIPTRCLPKLLGDVGLRSVFLQSATESFENRRGLVENMGFDDFIPLEEMAGLGFEIANYFGIEDAVMLKPSQDWLGEHGDQPFLATYLTVTPHHAYFAPRRYGHFDWFPEDELFNRYLNSVFYVDQFSRELLEQYQAKGLYEDTLFVFVGDHGEAFGEHGRYQHDNVIWEEGVHVPLFFYEPASPEAAVVEAPVSHLDIVPTILGRLGLELVGGELPGRAMEARDLDPEPVFAHCWSEMRCMAKIGERWKFIYHFHHRPPEVFDLLDDPGETKNLYGEMEEQAKGWEESLKTWRATVEAVYRR